jgi:uncharacterized protein YeaO (DUF488 family)
MAINLKRVYEPVEPEDGQRLLVERLWPRGVRKEALALDAWLKDVAPSDDLRRWFGHDPQRWQEFQTRYAAELDAHPDAWRPILEAARQGTATLLFSARDTEHNNAVALKAYLERRTFTSSSGVTTEPSNASRSSICSVSREGTSTGGLA